jgi:DNA-binding transcriptional ArsR family regulator
MVNYSADSDNTPLDTTFGALADPTRRAILARLARGEATVTELAAPFDVSLPAVSKHLRVLESAGLLRREIDGRIHRCRLAPQPMKDAAAWIETYRIFWEAQLDALANYLESTGASARRSSSESTNRSANRSANNSNNANDANKKEKHKWQSPKAVPTSHSRSAARSLRRAKKSSPRGPNPHN